MKQLIIIDGPGFSARPLQARLTAERAAELLGFQANDIPILVSARLLKPLGHPPNNGQKYFAAVQLQEFASDPAWLAKASDAIVDYWSRKNGGRRSPRHRFGAGSLATEQNSRR